ncbi:GNAT family N-acetyltransferase [Pedobacter fastidiosus]|uniref:GNAT family N-acetyltransferase n=1 Tax=Pedobacter fastidiosus TaxID=2765361 RepID=A0ABR7KS43_9SPHI|nr:GNAT family N-acetyltransferase [Pedobacter fastidiosus]MBC6110882.1 GNAT family N-acetyltransferase [Pedobacter fastidiosus]
MSISRANSTDVPFLHKLINSAYRGDESKKGWTTEAEILGGIRIDEQTLKNYFDKAHIRILKYNDTNGVILGTVYLELKKPEVYLGLFAVSPTLQAKGIGKALLQEAEAYALANGCDRIAISVISSRIELIEWYKRNGYIITGTSIAFEEIEGRFGEPKQNDIVLIGMEKHLSQ